MWSPQTEALFDIRIIDTNAPSYKHHTPEAVLESATKEKKRMYQKAVEDDVVPSLFQLTDSYTEFIKCIAAALQSNGRSVTQK